MTQISKYLTLADCVKSSEALRRGINNNTPTAEQIENLKLLGVNVYDKVKGKFPKCYPNSIFRSLELNTAIGGADTSQHMKGQAVDIDSFSNAYNLQILKWAIEHVHFDQMIAEFPDATGPSWVHISFNHELRNRGQILVAVGKRTGKGAYYIPFTGKESWFK